MDECNCNTLCGPLPYEYTLYGTQIEISFYRYHLLMGTSQQPFATREMHLQAKGIQSSLRVFLISVIQSSWSDPAPTEHGKSTPLINGD